VRAGIHHGGTEGTEEGKKKVTKKEHATTEKQQTINFMPLFGWL
jgi:hypothetical protein